MGDKPGFLEFFSSVVDMRESNLFLKKIKMSTGTSSATRDKVTQNNADKSTLIQWIPVHDKASGSYYFWDPLTQKTTWDIPSSLDLTGLLPADPFFHSKEYSTWYSKHYDASLYSGFGTQDDGAGEII